MQSNTAALHLDPTFIKVIMLCLSCFREVLIEISGYIQTGTAEFYCILLKV